MPEWTTDLRARLKSLRLSAAREAEIIEELSLHLDDRYRELIASGRSHDTARQEALADLREHDQLARHLRPLRQAHTPAAVTPGLPTRSRLLPDLWQDLRYAARMLRQ